MFVEATKKRHGVARELDLPFRAFGGRQTAKVCSKFFLKRHFSGQNKQYFFYHIWIIYKQYVVKLRFSSLRKFKLCISEKSYLFGAANVKSQKGMILAGELQFYQFPIGISLLIPCCKRGNTTKPEMGATSIWHPPCSGESITNWRCNTHPSILLGQTGILRSLHWRYFL